MHLKKSKLFFLSFFLSIPYLTHSKPPTPPQGPEGPQQPGGLQQPGDPQQRGRPFTRVFTTTTMTTEEEDEDFTFPPLVTLSDKMFSDAAYADHGKYSPGDKQFEYFNMQNYYKPQKFASGIDRCYKQYFRCILSQVYPYAVCAITYDDPYYFNFFGFIKYSASFPSYCDAYLQNCRRNRWTFHILYENFCVEKRFDLQHNARRALRYLAKALYLN